MQFNSWSMMKSSGMLDSIPAVITSDALSKLYGKMINKLNIDVSSYIAAIVYISTKAPTAGQPVDIDGSKSTNKHPLTPGISVYEWIINGPDKSTATPADRTAVKTTFTPDLPGSYEVLLRVTDSMGNEALDTAVIVVP